MMNRWEDIVKERLEGYESTLPEDSLAAFHAFRSGRAAKAGRSVYPWVLGAMAIAAGVSAVLFLRRQEPVLNMIPAEQAPSVSLAAESDLPEMVPSVTFVPHAVRSLPSVVAQPEVVPPVPETFEEDPGEPAAAIADTASALRPEPDGTALSPYLPQQPGENPVRMKAGPVAGIVAGSGLSALLVASLVNGGKSSGSAAVPADNPAYTSRPEPHRQHLHSHRIHHRHRCLIRCHPPCPLHSLRHRFPLVAGFTFWIPVSDRLNVMTGLEYSQYVSRIGTSSPVGKKQIAQYIGIPLRLDWTLSSSNRIKTYLGVGWGADYCFRATRSGEPLAKGGIDLSLMGAGGIQLNVGRRAGLYVEPRAGWTVLNGNKALKTYRTEHAPMFSVAGGIRITLGK